MLENGRLRLEDALRLAAQIADALSAVHRAGVVHRDVKPANVLVSEHGDVKLIDFSRNVLPNMGIVMRLNGT